MRRNKEIQMMWRASGRKSVSRICSRTSTTSTKTPPPATESTSEKTTKTFTKPDYRNDYVKQRNFNLDMKGIVSTDGKIYPFTTELVSAADALDFPVVHGSNLNCVDMKFPAEMKGDAKIVCFSIKDFGFRLARTWCDPFVRRYNPVEPVEGGEFSSEEDSFDSTGSSGTSAECVVLPPPSEEIRNRVSCYEIMFIEYSFLWFARKTFANSTKSNILKQQHDHTIMSFGAIKKFQEALELPSKFTGYVYLLDRNNKIRWKGAGQSNPEQLNVLYKLTEELLAETDQLAIDKVKNRTLAMAESTRKELIKEARETCAKKE